MTKFDFKLIARGIAQEMEYARHLDTDAVHILEMLVKRYVVSLTASHSNFDKDEFIKNCQS